MLNRKRWIYLSVYGVHEKEDRDKNIYIVLLYKWWYYWSPKRGLAYSRYLSYRTRGIAVILTIEYCTVVRQSYMPAAKQ